ncbi:MAG: DUF882 domain-containing protein [Polyangiaceae bacterium]
MICGLVGLFVSTAVATDPVVSSSTARGTKKGDTSAEPSALLATLAFVHTGERVVLDTDEPTNDRFSALVADRVTGQEKLLDPRLLGLLRTLAKAHPAARIEIVSGFRSPKLNEMLRKKGHHVASHSQHSLGHACDFRIIPAEQASLPRTDDAMPVGIDPRQLEKDVRALGWAGGVGVYVSPRDWFVHADVGPNRRWWGK